MSINKNQAIIKSLVECAQIMPCLPIIEEEKNAVSTRILFQGLLESKGIDISSFGASASQDAIRRTMRFLPCLSILEKIEFVICWRRAEGKPWKLIQEELENNFGVTIGRTTANIQYNNALEKINAFSIGKGVTLP
jgi:hypothetical protein